MEIRANRKQVELMSTDTTLRPLPNEIGARQNERQLYSEKSQPLSPNLSPALEGKKVLVTSESLGPINGVTRATHYLLEYLAQRNIKVAAVAPEFGPFERSPLRKKLPLIRLAGLGLFFNPDLLIARPFRMDKIIRRTFRPDIIYLASPASLGFQVWWQLRKSNIPMVANFQTDLAAYCQRMFPHPFNCLTAKAVDWLQAKVFKHAAVKAVLCPSTASRGYLIKLGVPTSKLRLVGRGVDSHFFNPTKRSQHLRNQLTPHAEVLLLCVSRLSLEKGFDFLAEAYAEATQRAVRRGMHQKFRLVITGGNSNQAIEKNIKALFEKKGLDVCFTGPLTGEPLAQIFASADIFVFSSLTETFGQVIQEAMASGLPVVALRAGGPADLVEVGTTGFLAEPGQVSVFAEHILRLVEDGVLRRRMGFTARRCVEGRSWDAINERIAQILAESAR